MSFVNGESLSTFIIGLYDKYHSRQLNNEGVAFYQAKEYLKAYHCFCEAIKGNPQNENAHFNLGLVYENRPHSKDILKAAKHYHLAYKNGYAPARAYFDRLIQLLSADALNDLAIAVDNDASESTPLYRLASSKGSKEASFNLGLFYKTEHDYINAVKCFQLSLDRGLKRGRVALSGLLYEADGKTAVAIGLMYLRGIEGVVDEKEALKWFRKAESLKYPEAYYHIGSFYSHGRGGLEQSISQAEHYYSEAQRRGFSQAKEALSSLLSQATQEEPFPL